MGEKSGRRGRVPALLPHLTVSRHLLCSHPRTRTNQPLIYLLEPKLKPPHPRWDENKAFAGDNGSEKASQALESILVYFLASLFHGGPGAPHALLFPLSRGLWEGTRGRDGGRSCHLLFAGQPAPSREGVGPFPPQLLCSAAILPALCVWALAKGKCPSLQ